VEESGLNSCVFVHCLQDVKVVWLTYITLHYQTGPDIVFMGSYMVTGWWLIVKLEELKVLPALYSCKELCSTGNVCVFQ
jgi:hypothetical protein